MHIYGIYYHTPEIYICIHTSRQIYVVHMCTYTHIYICVCVPVCVCLCVYAFAFLVTIVGKIYTPIYIWEMPTQYVCSLKWYVKNNYAVNTTLDNGLSNHTCLPHTSHSKPTNFKSMPELSGCWTRFIIHLLYWFEF